MNLTWTNPRYWYNSSVMESCERNADLCSHIFSSHCLHYLFARCSLHVLGHRAMTLPLQNAKPLYFYLTRLCYNETDHQHCKASCTHDCIPFYVWERWPTFSSILNPRWTLFSTIWTLLKKLISVPRVVSDSTKVKYKINNCIHYLWYVLQTNRDCTSKSKHSR